MRLPWILLFATLGACCSAKTTDSPPDKIEKATRLQIPKGIYSSIVVASKRSDVVTVEIQGTEQGRIVVGPFSTVEIRFGSGWDVIADNAGQLVIVEPLNASWNSDIYGWGTNNSGPRRFRAK